MIRNIFLAVSLILSMSFLCSPEQVPAGDLEPAEEVRTSASERELYDMIMQYRRSNSLSIIPLSPSLSVVAQAHCKDLVENEPDKRSRCNLHSWSESPQWSSCCYTEDHKAAECMWNKPRELSDYEGHGFEISYRMNSHDPNYIISPKTALDGWKKSRGHNDVIVNRSTWKDAEWKAIGVGIYKGVSTVWFGMEEDPAAASQ